MVTVSGLTAEHLVDPLGLDVAAPRLSWRVTGTRWQVSYRLRVSGDRVWDSGRVVSGQSVDIAYAGPPLEPEDRCTWQVEVEDETGARALSEVARFERMPARRTGTWICLPPPTDAHDGNRPCVHVRTVVELAVEVAAARLHVTGGGLVEPWLNGARVGDDRLAPGWTDYAQRVRCRSFDVTAALARGANALGAVIGDGWYAGRIGWAGERAHYGRVPVAQLELVVHLADGSVLRVGSDESWRACFGPVRSGDLLAGERYDARDALPGWSEASYDDSGWERAWPDPGPTGALVSTPCEPVRALREVPGTVRPGRPGSWLVDLGEVVGGWPRLTVGGEAGQIVRLRCAEALEADGLLHTANLRGAQCTDEVVLARGQLTWEPTTTYRGFRYVEVTGAEPLALSGVVAATDARPTGEFSCSAELLNAVWGNVRRTVQANTIGLPTDCVQRDERLGWLADAETGFATATYLYDLGSFWGGWLQEVRGAQSEQGAFPDVAPRLVHLDDGAPGWGDAGVLLPWALWEWYADRRVLEESVASMARWPLWVLAANPDHRWLERRGHDFGDWLAPGVTAPKEVVAQAYWARSSALAAAASRVVGRPDPTLEALAVQVREAFVQDHVDATGRVADGSQTGQLLALAFDLLPERLRAGAQRHLVESVEAAGLADRLPRHPPSAAGADRRGTGRPGLPAGAGAGAAVLGAHGAQRCDNGLGALGRLDRRGGVRRPVHELALPRLARLGGRVAARDGRRVGARPGRARLDAGRRAPAARGRRHRRPDVVRQPARALGGRLGARRPGAPGRRGRAGGVLGPGAPAGVRSVRVCGGRGAGTGRGACRTGRVVVDQQAGEAAAMTKTR